jgi:hypothetical protein
MGERLVALAEKFDLPYFRWVGRYFMGWAKTRGLTLSEGLALMEEAFPPFKRQDVGQEGFDTLVHRIRRLPMISPKSAKLRCEVTLQHTADWLDRLLKQRSLFAQ